MSRRELGLIFEASTLLAGADMMLFYFDLIEDGEVFGRRWQAPCVSMICASRC